MDTPSTGPGAASGCQRDGGGVTALDLTAVTRAMPAAAGEPPLRAQAESGRRVSKRRLAVLAAEYPETFARPKTYGECQSAGLGTALPCPFVGCAHHLYLEVDDRHGGSGSLKFNFPGREPDELAETCSLVVAGRASQSYGRLGPLLNLTRERVQQIEREACAALAKSRRARACAGDDGADP